MEKNEKQVDEGLQGNEKVETAIMALQQEPTGEMLAHTLTVIRRRMQGKRSAGPCIRGTGGRDDAGAGDSDKGRSALVGGLYRF